MNGWYRNFANLHIKNGYWNYPDRKLIYLPLQKSEMGNMLKPVPYPIAWIWIQVWILDTHWQLYRCMLQGFMHNFLYANNLVKDNIP